MDSIEIRRGIQKGIRDNLPSSGTINFLPSPFSLERPSRRAARGRSRGAFTRARWLEGQSPRFLRGTGAGRDRNGTHCYIVTWPRTSSEHKGARRAERNRWVPTRRVREQRHARERVFACSRERGGEKNAVSRRKRGERKVTNGPRGLNKASRRVSISCVIAAARAAARGGPEAREGMRGAGYLPYAPVIKFFERTIVECTGRSVQLKGKRFVSLPQRTLVIKRIRPVIEPNPSPLFLSLPFSPSLPLHPLRLSPLATVPLLPGLISSFPAIAALRRALRSTFSPKLSRGGERVRGNFPSSMLIFFFTPPGSVPPRSGRVFARS